MDIAIVTGASSSLGLAISKRLIQLGFRVYGLGGDYSDCPLQNVNFKPMACELSDPKAVEAAGRSILEKEKGVYLLINNAKYFGRNPFLEMDTDEIERIVRINLLCPLILTRTLAQSLMSLQGFLIQLGSPFAETTRGGPAGAAAAGGLKWMGEVLFQDLRQHGVKVCHLSPEPNRGRDPRSVARPGARTEASIDPEAVAQAIEQILQSPFGNIVTEMILRPLRVQEPDQQPVVRLPYPEPKPVPYTIPREFLEAEEQLEDEEWEEKSRQKRERSQTRSRETPEKPKPVKADKPPARDKPPPRKESGEPSRKPQGTDGRPARDAVPATAERGGDQGGSARSESSRRRGRRKPRPPKVEVGFHDRKGATESSPPTSSPPRQPAPAPESSTRPPQTKPDQAQGGKEGAPDKAVKKVARKRRATKKSAVKTGDTSGNGAAKTARKSPSPRKKTARKQPARKAARPKDGESG